MAPFRKCVVFGLFFAVTVAMVSTAPTDFEEELAFLNSLKADLMYNQYDAAITIQDIPKTSTRYLIEKYGYPAETHTVTTEDGYILTVYRIPNPGRPAVFIQHGILASSADWVVLGPKKALALMLHDAGYDVWMGNSRGSTYSRNHVSMSPSEGKFWDFSWHEIGIYDLPACIDYVLKKTGQKDLIYVAHSQGTTAFFVLMSQRPEYNQKVKAMFAMAPVAFLHEIKSFPLRVISLATSQIGFIAKMLGVNEFLPSTEFTRRMSAYLCSDQSMTQGMCTNILFMICGFNSDQLNKTMLPEILENIPAGASTKQIVHFGQLIRRDPIFRQFDYGWIQNLLYYGSWNPPSYDLSKVTTQVHLHYGENDLVAAPEGVSLLNKLLPNSVEYRRVPHDRWNHMDFLFAKDARDLIYDRILTKVKKIAPVNTSWWGWPWTLFQRRQAL